LNKIYSGKYQDLDRHPPERSYYFLDKILHETYKRSCSIRMLKILHLSYQERLWKIRFLIQNIYLARSCQDHEILERKPNLDRPICNLDYTLFTKFFHIWVKTNNYQIVYKNVVYFNIN